jgi:hypothetical protein
VLIVPSCKFHLPGPHESGWKTSEYAYTTRHIESAWRSSAPGENTPMPLEKDFSPTLAGSDRAEAQARILEWLRAVPELIRNAAENVRIGLKIFNALFDDEFQLAMLRTIHEPGPGRPDFYVYANRLFDPDRVFEGHRGIAYGGPDLSERNLRIAAQFQTESDPRQALAWSATGDITTGKIALEYALRGASSFQMHTVFQLPASAYRMTTGSRAEKALHELTFHPQTGFVAWLLTAARLLKLETQTTRLTDVIGRGPDLPA